MNALIEATRLVHGDGTPAYLCYMAVRLFEVRRVLKDTGSLYLHCDHTANAYLRQLLDGIFGNGENGKPGFRNEVVWRYSGGGMPRKAFGRKHDTIMFYTKGRDYNFAQQYRPYAESASGRHSDGTPFNYERGAGMTAVWTDISPVNTQAAERTGYPTQKPVALAERIIKASCPEGGFVLDCFAGCAYVAVAAERLNRNWVACDINPRAWTVFRRQFEKPKLALLQCEEPLAPLGQQQRLLGNNVTVHGPRELPQDTIREETAAIPALQLSERRFKVPASIIPEVEMKEILLRMSGYRAWCCGFANRMPDGTVIETTRNFHLDHMVARSREGTSHQITNRAPLCMWHNIVKGNHDLHLSEYRKKIAADGELMVDDISELMNLTEAAQRTLDIYSARQVQKRLPA